MYMGPKFSDIKNKPDSVVELANSLDKKGFEWFFGGSRSKLDPPSNFSFNVSFLKEEEETADWDFCVKSTGLVVDFCSKNGFKLKDISCYQDLMTSYVYEKQMNDGAVIQISLKHPHYYEDFKTAWQTFVTSTMFFTNLWKRSPYRPHKESIASLLEQLMFVAIHQRKMLTEYTWE